MTIDEVLQLALAEAPRGQITFPRDLHGFPGTVHGGAVAALLYRLALPRPPVHLRLDLAHGVPTETSLRLTTGSSGSQARLALEQGGRRLAEARLSREELPIVDPGPVREVWVANGPRRGEIPGTRSCLACGSANPFGLGVRFSWNDRLLWREYTPPETYRTSAGWAHPALATILLDELGWWLGALAQQECGVTTEVAITIFRPLPFGPLLVVGDRQRIRADAEDPRGRYCRASGYLLTLGGDLLALGEVRFAGSRAYTKRLLDPFLVMTDLDTLASFFPSARQLSGRDA